LRQVKMFCTEGFGFRVSRASASVSDGQILYYGKNYLYVKQLYFLCARHMYLFRMEWLEFRFSVVGFSVRHAHEHTIIRAHRYTDTQTHTHTHSTIGFSVRHAHVHTITHTQTHRHTDTHTHSTMGLASATRICTLQYAHARARARAHTHTHIHTTIYICVCVYIYISGHRKYCAQIVISDI